MARKPINIEDLKNSANHYLNAVASFPDANDSIEQRCRREGVASLVEHALTTTGNYNGYRHTDPAFLAAAEQDREAANTKLCEGGFDQTIRTYL
jgi:hypothetical protein